MTTSQVTMLQHAMTSAEIATSGTPVPDRVMVVNTDTGDVLVGDGASLPAALPVIAPPGHILVRIWDTSAAAYVWPDGSSAALPALPVTFVGATDPVGAPGGRANAAAAVIGDRWLDTPVATP